eukprot:923384-Rhodomonas_salina.2
MMVLQGTQACSVLADSEGGLEGAHLKGCEDRDCERGIIPGGTVTRSGAAPRRRMRTMHLPELEFFLIHKYSDSDCTITIILLRPVLLVAVVVVVVVAVLVRRSRVQTYSGWGVPGYIVDLCASGHPVLVPGRRS